MKKGLKRFALTAFIAMWALLGLISPAAAQDVDSGDVEDLAGSITDKEPQEVVDALKGDFNPDNLPDGFSEAIADGAEGTPEAGMEGGAPADPFGASETEGYVGSVAFTLTAGQTEEEQDEAEAEGTLPPALPTTDLTSFDLNVIYVVVFDSEDSATAALDEAREDDGLAEQGLEVEESDEFGVPGLAASTSVTEEGVSTALGMNAAQVGNVLVLGISAHYDMTGAELETGDVEETARNLTASGILHLQESVEDL